MIRRAARRARAPALRASDAERERTATLLRDHAAAGRLTPEELVRAARRRLRAHARSASWTRCCTTCPRRPPTPAPTPARSRPGARERALHAIGHVVLVNVACNAIWLATGADGAWWPKWVLLAERAAPRVPAVGELGPGRARRDEARLGRGGVRDRATRAS